MNAFGQIKSFFNIFSIRVFVILTPKTMNKPLVRSNMAEFLRSPTHGMFGTMPFYVSTLGETHDTIASPLTNRDVVGVLLVDGLGDIHCNTSLESGKISSYTGRY